MRFKDEGIVLKTVRTRDTGMVLHTFSREAGRSAFFLQGVGNKKKDKPSSLLFPGSILQLEGLKRVQSSLAQITSYSASTPLTELRFSIQKSSISIFWMEVLSEVTTDGYVNAEMYDFVREKIAALNHLDSPLFPLFFVVGIAEKLGSFPHLSPHPFFDLREGEFVGHQPQHPDFFDREDSALFKTSFALLPHGDVSFSRYDRTKLLDLWLRYLGVQNQHPLRLKSLDILKTLFQS